VNAAGDGCDPACSNGAVNAAGDGCEDADATFSAPGTFADAGTFTPEKTGGSSGSGPGAIIGGVIGGLACCLLLIGALVFVKRRQGAGGGRKKMGENSDLPPGWSSFIDESSGYPCYVNDATGDTQWEKPAPSVEMTVSNPMKRAGHARNETQLPSGWAKDGEGNDKYYYNEDTGETTWDAPPGSVGGSAGGGLEAGSSPAHARTGTILPDGWGKDESGPDKYYFNEDTGETSWEAPEGSSGGSSGN
jgi:hypothetical protein